MTTAELLDVLWRDHVALAPQAAHIRSLLAARGELPCSDHLAFYTYGAPGIGADALARPFETLGWRARDGYEFSVPHLHARCWEHDDPALPRLLFCELAIDALSPAAQVVIGELLGQLPAEFGDRGDLPWAGRPWRATHAGYRALVAESEPAAWIAAFGFRVHHFAIDVGALATFPDLEALDAFLIEHGFRLDDRGGAIKGSPAARIECSATRPDLVAVEFADTTARIASCGYELVRRHRLPSGELFHGFAPASSTAASPEAGAG